MFDFLNLKPGSFGLDISDLSLKLAQVRKQKGRLNLSTINQLALPFGLVRKGEIKKVEKLSSYIRDLFKKTTKLRTKYVVASLPEEKSFLRVVQMPKMAKGELKKAVRFEAENYIPFSLDKVYLDSEPISWPKLQADKCEVLVTAVPKKIVNNYIKAIKKANLIPLALETETQAAVRAVVKGLNSQEPIYLIDLGATSTSFSVYYGRCLRFASYIPVSSESFTLAIAKALDKDREEAEALKRIHGLNKTGRAGQRIYRALKPELQKLIQELKKHIDYYESHSKSNGLSTNGKKASKLLLYGGGVELPGLEEYLSQNFSIKVEKCNPLINLSANSENFFARHKKKPLSFVTAIGLALRDFEQYL